MFFECGGSSRVVSNPARSSWEFVILPHSQTCWIGNPGGVAEVEPCDGVLPIFVHELSLISSTAKEGALGG